MSPLFTADASLPLAGLKQRAGKRSKPGEFAGHQQSSAAPSQWGFANFVSNRVEHTVVVDALGVWAWSPADPHAAAQRHVNLASWLQKNPRTQVRILVSGSLVHSVKRDSCSTSTDDSVWRQHARQRLTEQHGEMALSWPLASWASSVARGVCALAGVDWQSLARCAQRNEVAVNAVEPWWHHAFEESKRCVSALSSAARSNVCVVEGQQIIWITAAGGELVDVRQIRLPHATLDALRAAIQEVNEPAANGSPSTASPLTVILGQGLADGANARNLNAHVLGRLDGAQPPHWLRPSTMNGFH